MATIVLPAMPGRLATVRAADSAAPEEMPPGIPSERARRRAWAKLSSLPTWMISSITSVSRMSVTKPAPMPWIGCGDGCPPESTGLAAGSTATICRPRLRGLGTLPQPVVGAPVPPPAAGARPPPPPARDPHVDGTLRVGPDLLGRGPAVNGRIGRVAELVRCHRGRMLGQDLGGLGDGTLHPLLARCQHDLGTQELQHLAPLDRHRLRHGQD